MLPILQTLSRGFNVVAFKTKQYAPQIATASGIALGLGTVVLACAATIKAKDVVSSANTELEAIKDTKEKFNDYTDDSYKKDTRKVVAKTTVEVAKIYALPAATGVASVGLILFGSKLLNDRYVKTAIGLAGVASSFKDYRKGVIDRYGEEVDRQIRYGLKEEEVKEKVVDENGKTKIVKKKIAVLDKSENRHSPEFDYRRCFDRSNPYWQPDNRYNFIFINMQQKYFNDLLQVNGHVFLNDVLQSLGFPTTRAGQEVGWRYNPDSDGDGYIDFRATEVVLRDQVDELGNPTTKKEKVILLDFNVDGSILNNVDWPDQK